MKDIVGALNLIGTQPQVGHIREDLTSRPIKFWPVHLYLVVYDPAKKPVEILRILHGMRDIEQILS